MPSTFKYEVFIIKLNFEKAAKKILRKNEVLKKSSSTPDPGWTKSILKWQELAGQSATPAYIIYGGDEVHTKNSVNFISWKNLDELFGF